jgi:5-methylcytosine-specific restriction endonuclease McrA
MYWVKTEDGHYELMDGQQRTVSICQYIASEFSILWDGQPRGFSNLTHEEQEKILDYELSIYVCEGPKKERLDWFKIINIAGQKLTDQELRNAMYTGPWLTDAKRWFSKTGGPAAAIGDRLVSGAANRQEILEKALKWISNAQIEQYMADHQHDANANKLWQYYQAVVDWVNRVFPNQDSSRVKIMRGLEWGKFYNEHKDDNLNAQDLETRTTKLIEDDEVENKRGVYEYLLSGDERTLNLRTFEEKIKIKKYEEQKGICVAKNAVCGNAHFELNEMEADHITPWSQGGKTIYENCQMLCRDDNRRKGST